MNPYTTLIMNELPEGMSVVKTGSSRTSSHHPFLERLGLGTHLPHQGCSSIKQIFTHFPKKVKVDLLVWSGEGRGRVGCDDYGILALVLACPRVMYADSVQAEMWSTTKEEAVQRL